ncbi:cell wall metabolism sensor histidine kinase WalK [Streptomyces sp. Wb2n-11]|uniref:sensor histidine kinase n=1 Tax=Streptomyces sp. Wb2n-11 TaxID=1030533 RepID=UPI000AE52E00|nr:HAMP domain-containing sensor histidine kinase [Streptomyces sp. Wb2n-11]
MSLRSRLVLSALALIAVVAAVIGTVTTIALHSYLESQLDGRLVSSVRRAEGVPPGEAGQELRFVAAPGQPLGTVGGLVAPDGTVPASAKSTEARGARPEAHLEALSGAQARALGSVERDAAPHTVTLPGLGDYRVASARDGSVVLGFPLGGVQDTVSTLIVVEVCVTAAGLVAAGLAGTAIVGVALRPLRRVAATATRVSELPLHSGEVALHERVRGQEADPRTEVGQVGAALNRMLGHVGSALAARQESETRVRQFVADASHELRTPLASIRGYAELTRRGQETAGPDTRHALGRIESEAARMTGLVEDLLLLARLDARPDAGPDAGRPRPLSYERTDLSPLVVDAVSDARVAGQGHVWRLELPDEPAVVRGDPARLQQVLVNLLANARTHTPPGTTVTARVRLEDGRVVTEVADDGPGIAPALLPYVFERFARGDASRARRAEAAGETASTGLGLAIVRAVVVAHGGGVTVESTPGRTVFAVRLPAAAREAREAAPA